MGAKSRRKVRAAPGTHHCVRFCCGCLRVRGRTDSDASVVELTSAPLTPEGLLFQAARGSYNCSPMSRNLVRSNNRTVDSFGSRNDRRVRSVLDLLAEEYVVEYFYLSADGIYALTRLSNSAVERSNLSGKRARRNGGCRGDEEILTFGLQSFPMSTTVLLAFAM